jgi:hypothetical protein
MDDLKLTATPLDAGVLLERLRTWPGALSPVADALAASAPRGVFLEQPGDAVVIGHRPDVAPHAYDFTIFPPLDENMITFWQTRFSIISPEEIREFLYYTNGLHFFELKFMAYQILLWERSHSLIEAAATHYIWPIPTCFGRCALRHTIQNFYLVPAIMVGKLSLDILSPRPEK